MVWFGGQGWVININAVDVDDCACDCKGAVAFGIDVVLSDEDERKDRGLVLTSVMVLLVLMNDCSSGTGCRLIGDSKVVPSFIPS